MDKLVCSLAWKAAARFIARTVQLKKPKVPASTTTARCYMPAALAEQLQWPLMPLASPKQPRGSGWSGPSQARGIVPLSHSIRYKSTWSLQRRQSQEWLFHNKGTNSMDAPALVQSQASGSLVTTRRTCSGVIYYLQQKKTCCVGLFFSLFLFGN